MKKRKYKEYPTYYLFTDIEGTGLNFINGQIRKNDLLEISYVLLDYNLFTITKNTYISSISDVDISDMSSNVQKMHSKNGLLSDCEKSSLTRKDIDRLIFEELKLHLPKNNEYRLILSGNTIQYDYEAIRRNLPNTFSLLHHRVLDVSSVREAIKIFNSNFTKKVENEKNYTHRATQDIEDCIKELKKYKSIIRS